MKELKKEKNKSASENGVLGFLLVSVILIGLAIVVIWGVLEPINK